MIHDRNRYHIRKSYSIFSITRNSTMGRFLIRKYWPKRSVRAKRKWVELKLLIFSINSFSRFREIFENMAVTMYLAGGGNAPCN